MTLKEIEEIIEAICPLNKWEKKSFCEGGIDEKKTYIYG